MQVTSRKDQDSSLILKAPAKINLFLKILSRRPDGYHEIESLMQKVDLCDILHLSWQGETISVSCPESSLPEDRDNLVYRAAELFLKTAGIRAGIKIILEKNIPVAAGLGGGSSDAAAVINGLNTLADTGFSPAQLMEIARPLGADVPFFVQGGSAALAVNIGDNLTQAEPLHGFWIVLVNPGFGVSTKWVYENFPLTSRANPYILARGQDLTKDFHAMGPGLYEELGNDLEVVTITRYPEIGNIKRELKEAGAAASLMSGSGPTVFGLFQVENDAQQCFQQLSKKYGGKVFLTRPYIP